MTLLWWSRVCNKSFTSLKECWPTPLCGIVLIQSHWRVFEHERPVSGHGTPPQSDLAAAPKPAFSFFVLHPEMD